jgi:hypothetical protein
MQLIGFICRAQFRAKTTNKGSRVSITATPTQQADRVRRRQTSRQATPRREVTMMKRLRQVLRLGWQPALRDKTLFNGQLLDQNREDVYVVLHQMGGVIR